MYKCSVHSSFWFPGGPALRANVALLAQTYLSRFELNITCTSTYSHLAVGMLIAGHAVSLQAPAGK